MSDEETTPATPDTEAPPPAAEPSATTAVADEPPPEAPAVATGGEPAPHQKKWYVVKVQSGREDSIRGNLERRVKPENLEAFVGPREVPGGRNTEVRDGKRRIKKVKKFPGYLFCEVEFNEHVLYLFRETSGVGDFVGGTGSGPNKLPQPMSDREVQRMLADQEELTAGETPGKK